MTANAVSRQQVDSAIAAARTAKANVDAARQQVSANQAQAAVAQSQITTDEAEVQQAQAHVQEAQLNLSYTKIYAPEGRPGHAEERRAWELRADRAGALCHRAARRLGGGQL